MKQSRGKRLRCQWFTIDFKDYVDAVEESWPFSQANYGDGEWSSIVRGDGKINSDGVPMAGDIGKQLEKTLTNPCFTFFGFNCGPNLDGDVYDYQMRNGMQRLPWVYKETISAANCNGYIAPLFNALNQKRVLLVGGPHLSKLEIVHPEWFVKVHITDAVYNAAEITKQCLPYAQEADVICFAAGFATNLVMHDLLIIMGDAAPVMLDMGACFDPYVGLYNRKRYRTKEWQQKEMVKNIRETT